MRLVFMCVVALATVLAPQIGASASAQDEYDEEVDPRSAYIWNGTSSYLVVTDNGNTVCNTPPNTPCMFTMTDGVHSLVLMGPNGYSARTFNMTVNVPYDDPPSSAFQDCDFAPGGCPRPW